MELDPETIRRLAKLTLSTRPEELSCDDWVHLVGEYVEATESNAELTPRQKLVELHAEGCVSCQAELQALREILGNGEGSESTEPPVR